MENKLQELTKKLYEDGLSKGRHDADTLLADTQAKAKKIIADAEADAARIKKQAETSASDLRKNTLTELSLAGKQVIGTLQGDISSMIVAKAVKEPVSKAVSDPDFIKELLLAVTKNWKGSSSEKVELKAMLPAAQEKELDKSLGAEIKKIVGNGLEVEYSDGVKSGFKIGPKDGGYYIDFSDESFYALLSEYLRPKVAGMLYGDKE